MNGLFRIPVLNRRRIWLAMIVAVLTDALQLLLGPWGWVFFDQAADVVAMSLITLLIGFHPLLLPTFLVEFFPGLDLRPWMSIVAPAGTAPPMPSIVFILSNIRTYRCCRL